MHRFRKWSVTRRVPNWEDTRRKLLDALLSVCAFVVGGSFVALLVSSDIQIRLIAMIALVGALLLGGWAGIRRILGP